MAATGETPSSQIDRPGAEAWQLMWEVFKASKPYLEAVAGEFELSPQQLYAFKHLSNERPLAITVALPSTSSDHREGRKRSTAWLVHGAGAKSHVCFTFLSGPVVSQVSMSAMGQDRTSH